MKNKFTKLILTGFVFSMLSLQTAFSQTRLTFSYDVAGNQTGRTVTVSSPRSIALQPGVETDFGWFSAISDNPLEVFRARCTSGRIRYALKSPTGQVVSRGRDAEIQLSLSMLDPGDYTLTLRRGVRKDSLFISIKEL
jgi:hypothetical protein